MKIFQLKHELVPSSTYLEFKICEESPWLNEKLFRGEYSAMHDLPIPLYTENKLKPNDYPYSVDSYIVSKFFLDVIKNLNSDFEALESVVFYRGKNLKAYCEQSGNTDGKIWDTFYTMIYPQYNLFNWEKSVYESDVSFLTGEKFISKIEKLVIDKNKLNENEAVLNKNNIFILGERKLFLLCTEKAKQKIEEAGISGISFEEVEVM